MYIIYMPLLNFNISYIFVQIYFIFYIFFKMKLQVWFKYTWFGLWSQTEKKFGLEPNRNILVLKF